MIHYRTIIFPRFWTESSVNERGQQGLRLHQQQQIKIWASFAKEQKSFVLIMSFHSIRNVVDRSVLQAMCETLAGQVGHHVQLVHYPLTTPI